MNLLFCILILLCRICLGEGGYGSQIPQSDVEAPAYTPPYLKNQRPGPTKTFTGTKTYTGTKTGYSGRKTYSGTKTAHGGAKTVYGGTKTAHGGGYGEHRTWQSSGSAPSYKEFQSGANNPYSEACDVQCKNNGICVDRNTCQCPPNYEGKYCEFEKKPCLDMPPLPMNSAQKCYADLCVITCREGHKFFDGSSVANMKCTNGQWRPTRADLTSLSDCQPECNPPCENNGVCLSVNTCQCPADFRGPQCQYAASVCDVRKLGFNGGYKCFGDADKFGCRLSCPAGASFSSPASDVYYCQYSTGIFEPQPIPHCIFDEVIVITPTNPHHVHETFYSLTSSNSTSEYMGYSHSSTHRTGKYGADNSQVTVVIQDLTPKAGSCLMWGGVHYKTFDGKIYSFQSPCTYTLIRDPVDHKYTVAVRQPECKRADYCPLELTIYLEEKMFKLAVDEDGSVLLRNQKRLIPIPATLPNIRVSMPSDQVIVSLDHGLTIKWDTNNLVIVEASVLLWNKTEGLCGTLDGNPENDMITKEGIPAQTKSVMAASWELNKIGELCDGLSTENSACNSKSEEDMKKALKFCTKIFTKNKFRKCSKVMDVSQLLQTCQWDYCACAASLNPEECACRTVSVYAKECVRHGVDGLLDWRDSDTCPMKCPEGKIYKSCGPDTQPSCAFPDVPQKENTSCVEGCFCPEGLFLESGKCVQKRECPCRIRNKTFPPGSVVPKSCNTCTCSDGSWVCTAAACGARCGAVGDPHYTTFDGQRYNFMGHCTYTLLSTPNVTIEVENVACSGAITEAMNLAPYEGEGKPSCTKAVSLMYQGANIQLKQGGLILVNGKDVPSLPVNVGDIKIRAASSLFVIIQLPIKVDLWWDGNTRVFVDVPPTFQDQTKGLCGTFNLNQKDDFLTPEGDVEQSAFAFANKWKTRELCKDVATKEPDHPCSANPENRETADSYCSKLKGSLFESCHAYVDVQPYYEDCVYDMCACAAGVERCLCPILGDYAMACAAAGIMTQWRYHVKECEVSCSGGQEYTVCADSCTRTCADVASRAECRPSCVEGCACPPGQVLDNDNVCVPVGLCPCYHKGLEFKPNYKEVRPGRRERELCTCVGAQWECVPATDADVQNYPPAEDLRSNCSAADHREFTTCEIAEPLTCKNMHLPPTLTSQECRPGCQCKKGYVLDSSSNACVLPTDCPCHHGGRSYPDGHVMQEECNDCKCESGKWQCSSRACAGVCGAWGDSHVRTFDGELFDFQGVCTYLLAKGSVDGNDGFNVEIQNAPCGTTGATCSKSVTLRVVCGGVEEAVSLTKDAPLPDTTTLKKIKLRIAGAYVFLDVPSIGMSLQWDRALRVYVKVEPMWKNRVKGLCGNYNSDTRDDFQTPSGGGFAETSALIFADSWKLQPTCPKAQEVTDHCHERPQRAAWAAETCGALKRAPFSQCHAEVPAAPYASRCEADACACDSGADCDCACAALAAYAHACAQRGVVFPWRTQNLCPMQCDEECSTYDECISPCPAESCDNTLDYAEIKAVCGKDACVEGCKPNKTCPEGTVYSNSSLKECVPRAKCKPVCMTLPNGKEILEGEIIEEDACHTCRCSKKAPICTGQPCSTLMTQSTTPSSPPETTPYDQPLKCAAGWTPWVSRGVPEIGSGGESIDVEPLPQLKELVIGSSMCSKENMTDIECRTVGDHKSAKETGLNVECSLERGLICNEKEKTCSDFEIRVLCKCEEDAFQCLNSSHPNNPHPSDCTKFYECTPEPGSEKPHAVLKSCPASLMYNPALMICDWPDNVAAIRPECRTTARPSTEGITEEPSTESTTSQCPPGQVYSECAYDCSQLCEHFERVLKTQGKCTNGERCVSGCAPEVTCAEGWRWRDEHSCVPLRDCTCQAQGAIVKPGGVLVSGCEKCQCLDNALHCDTSECYQPSGPTKGNYIMPTTPYTTPTEATEASTTAAPTTTEEITTKATTEAPTTILVKTTASPPPECSPERYKPLLWGEKQPPSKFTASSSASAMFGPQYAVLNGSPDDKSAGSWNPMESNKNQYLQVELPRREPIYGVVMQGSPLFDQFVTSYDLMYGDDGNAFSTVDAPDGKPMVFRGPVDHKSEMKQMIEPPIEAKFIRIRPLTWHDDISVRVELIGCGELPTTTTTITSTTTTTTTTTPSTTTASTTTTITTPLPTTLEPLQCTEPLGLGSELPVEMIEVSSNNDARPDLKMEAERGWSPAYSTPGEWIMFNFTSPRNITGIKTKGGVKGWVSSYNIMYTCDLKTFNPVLDSAGEIKHFPANFDKDSVVMNEFRPPLHAQYLKILPIKWMDNIEMHVEPIGCFEPYPVTKIVPTPREPAPCELCPGVPAAACACEPPLHYDGESCVPRDQCPCLLGYITYPVGASFRGAECDECICKMGGISDCRPAKKCTCEPDQVPNLTKDCKCLCEPCTNGTKICPSSKLCLPLEKWCDGLQDCPDDERDCGTTVVPENIRTTVIRNLENVPTTTPTTTLATTQSPMVCPKEECPPGYILRYTEPTHSNYYKSNSLDLPPPRPRYSYQRFQKGGFSKGGRGGYSKGGFSKTSYSKGGFNGPSAPQRNQAFTLGRPTLNVESSPKQECKQFRCVPNLPPLRPGSTHRPLLCDAPSCPPSYSLKLESTPHELTTCPQYACVPPPERPVFCNMTGRTITTFDGTEYKYDVCYHILARENRMGSWTVLVRKKCRPEGCMNELLVHQDDQLILVKPNMMIEYDNYEYTVEQTSKICFQKNSFDVGRLGNGLSVKSRKYNFTVLYNKDGDVKVGVYKNSLGHVDGLCGKFDGDASNDRTLPDGTTTTSTEKFAHGWAKPGLQSDACRASVCEPEEQAHVWELCKVITEEPLSKCAKVLNLDKWRSICLEKICKCADSVVNGTKRSKEECRCELVEQLVSECLAADKNVDLSSWRMQMDCPAECPAPLVHYDCYRRRCEPACVDASAGGGAVARDCPAEDGHCFPGCYCPEGKLRRGDECVAPTDCLDCSCTGVGTPAKYVTFEGDDLPFLGNCTYLASRDRNETGDHRYEIYSTNGPCEENNAIVCTRTVHLIREKNVIHISKDPETKKLLPVLNGKAVYRYPVNTEWASVSLVQGQDVSVLLSDLHVELLVFHLKLEFQVRVPSYVFANRTEGLCGVCAGDEQRLVTANGTVTDDVELYGKSWQASPESLTTLEVPPQQECGELPPAPECVLPPPEANPCYNINNIDKFGACHALVEPQPYVAACEADLCLNHTECDSLERYAADCARQGVCLDWRGDLCPLPCEAPLTYRPCVDCERTCDNYDELKNNPKKCDKQPVEGCFCPEGLVRVNNTCIEPHKCFPCDVNKEHYAGDEWQEDACTTCSCSKASGERARVACTTQTCSPPVCSDKEDLITDPPKPGTCCPKYLCVLKPVEERCEAPKKMECGYGQVLKQKTKDDGCPEFACECMPESQCEHVPTESEVEMLEPGMERVVDRSGCCPRARLECRREKCPPAPDCPRFHELRTANDSGRCCPDYRCEAPKDKCIVKLEWEAAPKGGEKIRSTPLEMLKEVESVWLDGPCRTCRCASSALGAMPQCSVTECPAIVSSEQFVLEPGPVPFACCPMPVHVACRDGDNIYKVGENWTSPYNPCESYHCAEAESDRLEKVTTVQNCDVDCKQGWEYVESTDPTVCCGHCEPVACIVRGEMHPVGDEWRSADFCTNYTCLNVNGTLQVQCSNETCPEVPESLMKQFVLSEEKIEGKCCPKREPIACRDGNEIYQEGQTWASKEPCMNVSCARDVSGRLTQLPVPEPCSEECARGWRYEPPTPPACCGRCVQHQCIVSDELKDVGTTWTSADNCTTYSCAQSGEDVFVTSAVPTCPDVTGCAPKDLVNETCCQVCKKTPEDLKTCAPAELSKKETLGLIRINSPHHGLCVNEEPLVGFAECRGSCDSGTLFNNYTGRHDTQCECCQATEFAPLQTTLSCGDGTRLPHRLASPRRCACRACSASLWPSEQSTPTVPTKTGHGGYSTGPESGKYDIPEIYKRFREY